MLRAIGRLLLVPIAFVLAVLAAVFVLLSLGMERLTHALHGRDVDTDTLATLFDFVWQGHLLLSAATVVPAILLIVVGEVARIRSALYYVLGAGAALAAIPLLARLDQAGAGVPAAGPVLWQVFATAGFAAGFVYWLIAGRSA